LDTIIQIVLERFLIQNPKGNSYDKNNQTRYSKKKITTYLLILKQKNMKYLIGNLKIILILKLKKYVKTQWLNILKIIAKSYLIIADLLRKIKINGEVLSPLINLFLKRQNFKELSYISNFF